MQPSPLTIPAPAPPPSALCSREGLLAPPLVPGIDSLGMPGPMDLVEAVDWGLFEREIVARGGEAARRHRDQWLDRARWNPAYVDIRGFVTAHDHAALFSLGLDDVRRVTRDPDPALRTAHAIGDVRWHEEGVRRTEKFATPWTLIYLLHGLMARMGTLPRWQDFDRFLRGAARARYYGPFTEHYGYATRPESEVAALERGFRYRAGNAYYSFLREVDVITRLRREHGLPVRYHLLADAHFKIDFWVGHVLVAMFVRNPAYRQGAQGRKERVEHRLDLGAFRALEIEMQMATARHANQPMLVAPEEVARTADLIRAALGEH